MNKQLKPTLEQQRAHDAWIKAQGRGKDYVNLSKSLPALVMNSGLMQSLAYLHSKDGNHHKQLEDHLRSWLGKRLGLPADDFVKFMEALMQLPPARFQQATSEAMAWLRWSRQMASAANNKESRA